MSDAVNYVDTEYSVFCADDDFITPNGISQSVDFLINNPDFTAAHGHYLSFRTVTPEGAGPRFYFEAVYPFQSNTSSDPVNRLYFHFCNYWCAIYAVYRTEFLNMILTESVAFTSDYCFAELLPSMITVVYGKTKHLDVLYAAREHIPASAGSIYKIKDFIEDGTYDKKYARFRDCLANHLSNKTRLDMETVKKVIDDAMFIYLQVKRKMKKEEIELLSIYDKLFLPGERLMDEFRRSVDDPSSKYYDDFNTLHNHVLCHSQVHCV